ncbi:IclR family transcriptional regulator [Bradyrhizobium sp. LeoA1S1]
MVWSATGFSLLTACTDKEIRSLCTRTNAEAALDISRIDINQVLENVERTRRDGFFFSAGLVTPGAGSIAVPLPEGIDGWNRALAVAVSGPFHDITRRRTEIVALLNDVVQRYLRPSSST